MKKLNILSGVAGAAAWAMIFSCTAQTAAGSAQCGAKPSQAAYDANIAAGMKTPATSSCS